MAIDDRISRKHTSRAPGGEGTHDFARTASTRLPKEDGREPREGAKVTEAAGGTNAANSQNKANPAETQPQTITVAIDQDSAAYDSSASSGSHK